MTEKLFYQDPFLSEFTAAVLACEETKGCWHITLDRTAFYPEGGGQAADGEAERGAGHSLGCKFRHGETSFAKRCMAAGGAECPAQTKGCYQAGRFQATEKPPCGGFSVFLCRSASR